MSELPLRTHDAKRTLLGLALISSAGLVFEISLTRVFAVQQFHHFAFMVVSLAVMGFAFSGLLLSIRDKPPHLALLSFGFAASIALSYFIINFLPFDSYSIAWDRKQIWILLLYFTASGLPFLFAGWVIGACLAQAGDQAYRPYAVSMASSALGCVFAFLALGFLGEVGSVMTSLSLGLCAAAIFTRKRRVKIPLLAAVFLIVGLSLSSPTFLSLELSPYKPLALAKLAPDAKHTLTQWSMNARVDVVESQSFHIMPGLSLNAGVSLPSQAALFLDGEGPKPINALSSADPLAAQIADHTPTSIAYKLRPNAQVLIVQPGAGLEAILALASGAGKVKITADTPAVLKVLETDYKDFSHQLLEDPRIEIIPRSTRAALSLGDGKYDLIIFALSQGYHPVTSGAFSLTENFTLTVEALESAYSRLEEHGLLVITRWLGTPPSESVRAWATLVAALEEAGVDRLAARLVAFRGMRTATMMVSSDPYSTSELNQVRAFLHSNAYDPIFLPDLDPAEINRYNQLPEDRYVRLFQDMLGDRDATLASYEFNLRPPSDNRPYFFHFFRWRQTPDVIAALGRRMQPFGGSGYLVLLALLALMVLLAIPCAVAPLALLRRNAPRFRWRSRLPLFFASLGAGYLLVEIPLIQRLTLLLDHPASALVAVLFSLLLSSGLGSLLSSKVPLRMSLAFLILYLLALNLSLPSLIELALPLNYPVRLLITFTALAPAGFLMGIPFASGLRILEQRTPGLIPWAWAVNGAASGLSGVIAALTALDLGLSAALGLGTAAYLGAWITAPKLSLDPPNGV